jgi:hypothetical protein
MEVMTEMTDEMTRDAVESLRALAQQDGAEAGVDEQELELTGIFFKLPMS